jgi:hypothetical protein
MEQFIQEIHAIYNPSTLEELKSHLKDKVTDMSLRWDERMMIYKKVQLINQWLSELAVESR